MILLQSCKIIKLLCDKLNYKCKYKKAEFEDGFILSVQHGYYKEQIFTSCFDAVRYLVCSTDGKARDIVNNMVRKGKISLTYEIVNSL